MLGYRFKSAGFEVPTYIPDVKRATGSFGLWYSRGRGCSPTFPDPMGWQQRGRVGRDGHSHMHKVTGSSLLCILITFLISQKEAAVSICHTWLVNHPGAVRKVLS